MGWPLEDTKNSAGSPKKTLRSMVMLTYKINRVIAECKHFGFAVAVFGCELVAPPRNAIFLSVDSSLVISVSGCIFDHKLALG